MKPYILVYSDSVRYAVDKGNTVGRERLAHALTNVQEEVLIGSLLGDARLECRSTHGTARLRIHHAESQRDYLWWKYEVFRPLAGRAPWRIEWFDRRTRKKYAAWFFHSLTLPVFGPYHQLFYPRQKKKLPAKIVSLLTPRVLAVWLMDDGCQFGGSFILNTQSFDLSEQHELQRVFQERFALRARVQRDRRNFRLSFNRTESLKFWDIVRPHVIPSMQRKILPVTTDPEPAHHRQG